MWINKYYHCCKTLKASNDTLSHRIERLERNFSVSSTPLASPQMGNKVSDLPQRGYVAPHMAIAPPQEPQQGYIYILASQQLFHPWSRSDGMHESMQQCHNF